MEGSLNGFDVGLQILIVQLTRLTPESPKRLLLTFQNSLQFPTFDRSISLKPNVTDQTPGTFFDVKDHRGESVPGVRAGAVSHQNIAVSPLFIDLTNLHLRRCQLRLTHWITRLHFDILPKLALIDHRIANKRDGPDRTATHDAHNHIHSPRNIHRTDVDVFDRTRAEQIANILFHLLIRIIFTFTKGHLTPNASLIKTLGTRKVHLHLLHLLGGGCRCRRHLSSNFRERNRRNGK